METVSTKLPERLLERVDRLVSEGVFASRSEFLRQSVREALERRDAMAERQNRPP